ncbi:hypothetical protein KSP40_PGU004123 [Platanthera guangdongensis]|uniref:Uncharacterized protein n=1 Tax=Platanthera guangdongensis TaxID=2320717 RepID=A0ABR2MQ88_9ASPA
MKNDDDGAASPELEIAIVILNTVRTPPANKHAEKSECIGFHYKKQAKTLLMDKADAPPSAASSSQPPERHRTEADDEDENVKQLNECSSFYLSLQECLNRTNRNWKSCQPEVQGFDLGHLPSSGASRRRFFPSILTYLQGDRVKDIIDAIHQEDW